jgi:flavin reductase (DIM6/NTAB) family NADH-FMN oxidoreductase RutF
MPAKKRKITKISSSRDPRSDKDNAFIKLDAELASRLLYPNPVVFLVTQAESGQRNVMTLSWLAPANNYGGFVFVIHKRRHSATNLTENGEFIMCIAHADQQELLLGCGKVSGSTVDKFDGSVPGLSVVKNQSAVSSTKRSGGNAFSALQEDSSDDEDAVNAQGVGGSDTEDDLGLAPISGSIAHLKCSVIRMTDAADAGHWLVVAQINEADVDPRYWDGKCFGPTITGIPSFLSFLGSQKFGEVIPK